MPCHSCGNKCGYTALREVGSGCSELGEVSYVTYTSSFYDVELVFPDPRHLSSEVDFAAAGQPTEMRVLSRYAFVVTAVVYFRLSFPILIAKFIFFFCFQIPVQNVSGV